ncbi:PEGA domain-containing protein [Candidatus Microgenomates bacterium]|nr:PEGA domain-containing protein [Candidatus Microgenomates bacterium]
MVKLVNMKNRVAIFFLTIILLLVGTTALVLYGRGYRLSFSRDNKTFIAGTGLLVATSNPDGAQILINGKLTSATNDTLNLVPGDYEVEIIKVGYLPWKKKLKVEKEVVTKTDVRLFPSAPKLESITSTGVTNPVLDPTRTRIAYKITSLTPEKNGLYIFEMGNRPILTLQGNANKLTDDKSGEFSASNISFSPNAKFLIATPSGATSNLTYLLSVENGNQTPRLTNEAEFSQLNREWQKEKEEKEASRRNSLKEELRATISANFRVVAWSPDETKILYEASSSATLPALITPPLLGASSQPEQRSLAKGKTYIYDIKEDKNFYIDTPSSALSWLDDRHLIVAKDGRIEILEYDGSNRATVYAGPFLENFVAAWPDGSKLVILTNLGNSDVTPNLYTVSLK